MISIAAGLFKKTCLYPDMTSEMCFILTGHMMKSKKQTGRIIRRLGTNLAIVRPLAKELYD
jgi:hypothetical protein